MREQFLEPINYSISAEYIDLVEIKPDITEYLTTWTEWSSCTAYCKRWRYRVCSGGFKCFDQKDGFSEDVPCSGNGCASELNL